MESNKNFNKTALLPEESKVFPEKCVLLTEEKYDLGGKCRSTEYCANLENSLW